MLGWHEFFSKFWCKFAQKGYIPLTDVYKIWHGGGSHTFARSRQILPFWLSKCAWAYGPKIAKNGNFGYKFPPKGIKYVDLYSASPWSTTSNALPFPVSRRWSPQANPTARHQRTLRDHVIRDGAPRDMPVLLPSFRWYQIILLGDRGSRVWTTCLRLLRSSVAAGPRTRDY